MRKYDEEAAARQIDRSVWMTREEAATFLGIPFNRLKPLIDRGVLKSTRRGSWFYVERASAKAYKERGGR